MTPSELSDWQALKAEVAEMHKHLAAKFKPESVWNDVNPIAISRFTDLNMTKLKEDLAKKTGVVSVYNGQIVTISPNRCSYCKSVIKDEDTCRNCGAPRE